ncbi:hypothetical protein LCGC14_2400070 [marine sediment metagenome]|uniref:Uncharacterized protein n=1 Tax=marine sediment metagenome TaxID=412755 RepID=A0A0F9CHP4_9ZZZZ
MNEAVVEALTKDCVMDKSIEFDRGLGEAVAIRASGLQGQVRGLFIDIDLIGYALVYYVDKCGVMREDYIRMHDLRDVPRVSVGPDSRVDGK